MKKFIKILLATVLATISVFTLTACGPKCKIGVQQGTTGELYVNGNADMLLPGYDNIECKAFNNGGLAVQAMLNGQIDYVIIDNEPAKQLVAQNSGIKMIDIALTTEEYAFGVDKAQSELLTQVNAILAELKTPRAELNNKSQLDMLFEMFDSLEYDEEGNVIGGDDHIRSFASAQKDTTNPNGQLVVATNAAFAPFEYKKGNEFTGIDIYLAAYIAEALDLELVIEDMDFEAVVTSVGKNCVDIAMAGLSVTATRKQSVNFSTSYYSGAYQVLVVKADNTEFDNCTTKEQIESILKSK